MIDVRQLSWPIARAAEAMQALADYAGLPHGSFLAPPAPASVSAGDKEARRTWMESTAGSLDLQVERQPLTYRTLPAFVGHQPVLLLVMLDGNARLIATASSRRKQLVIVPPQLAPVRSTVRELRSALTASLESELEKSLEDVLASAGVRGSARDSVLQSMLEERLGDIRIAESWQLGVPISSGMWVHARQAGVPHNLAKFLGLYAVEYALWIFSWLLVGKWALQGEFDAGWLLGWALVLLTVIPIHMLAKWQQAKLALRCGWVMMRLLLEGSFKLRPEEVRSQGVGQLLGRVLDSDALQSLALTGGLSSVISGMQLAGAAILLGFGAHAWVMATLLLLWIVLTCALAVAYHVRRRTWTTARLEVTQELIERMVGHRTRLAQQPRERWHEGEDECLARYLEQSRSMDWLGILYMLLPKVWLIVGIAALAPGIVSGTQSAGELAAQVGGIFLANTALTALSTSLSTLSGAVIAGERARDFLVAAARTEPSGDPAIAVAAATPSNGHLLEMRDVTFRYPHRATDAIQHNYLKIEPGDRVLLQGSSGSGKSTWVALASGVRVPDSGLLFLRGIDRKTLGDRQWRRRVVASPQFHENHLLTGTLAFNLLLGRGWPGEPEDLAEAEAICRELGLGPLLDRMPAGLMQMVGETGWQLSNGEKSRVYLARALLQRADLVVLDETLGALDPETAQQAVDCVLRRAPALLCVAHV